MTCPCGEADENCARYHAGEPAPTAEALMRSRYAAYVRGHIDYLVETASGPSDRAGIAARARDTIWRGLEIVATERGLAGDTDGIVEFIARGETRGVPFAQRERSRFRKANGRWTYVDAVEPGRNEACWCGSGKKFKKCHAR